MKNIWILSGALGVVAIGLAGCGGGNGGNTPAKAGGNGGNTPTPGGNNVQFYTQRERLARPVVNEVLATVAGGRHEVNNTDNPTDDKNQLIFDIDRLLTVAAGRDQPTRAAIGSVLVPDVMIADLTKTGPAAYLGVETNGATGGTFGGRALTNDVVDTSFGIVFGNTVSQLGLAPDDGKETPALTSDNVGDGAHQYLPTFPYLGNPH